VPIIVNRKGFYEDFEKNESGYRISRETENSDRTFPGKNGGSSRFDGHLLENDFSPSFFKTSGTKSKSPMETPPEAMTRSHSEKARAKFSVFFPLRPGRFHRKYRGPGLRKPG